MFHLSKQKKKKDRNTCSYFEELSRTYQDIDFLWERIVDHTAGNFGAKDDWW